TAGSEKSIPFSTYCCEFLSFPGEGFSGTARPAVCCLNGSTDREVLPTSSAVTGLLGSVSPCCWLTSSKGVADLPCPVSSCPGVAVRPRFGPYCLSVGRDVFFGAEKTPKKTNNKVTATLASRNMDLLLSRLSSLRLVTGLCSRLARFSALRKISRKLVVPASAADISSSGGTAWDTSTKPGTPG